MMNPIDQAHRQRLRWQCRRGLLELDLLLLAYWEHVYPTALPAARVLFKSQGKDKSGNK